MSHQENQKRDLTLYDTDIAQYLSEGKGWTEAISAAYEVDAEKAREIYRDDFENSNGAFEEISRLVNVRLRGPRYAYVYLPKPPLPDIEDTNAPYKAKYQSFWAEHPLQCGKPLEICPGFSTNLKPTRYKPSQIEKKDIPTHSNKFFEVKTDMDPINQFFSHEEKKVYGHEEGNKTEVNENVTDNFLIRQLKDLYAMAVEDKKYKEAKDCLELMGRIGGQIGEKVKKESVVTNKTVSEASEEFLHASKVLGLDLPANVTNIFEAQRKHK